MNNPQEYSKRIGKGMALAASLLLLGLLTLLFNRLLEPDDHYTPQSQVTAEGLEVTLKGDQQGHYVSNGTINGHPVRLMVDTGATLVSIPLKVADRIGLKRGPRSEAMTANGRIEVYLTRLREVTVGGITETHVLASIIPDHSTEEVLLGMSFLGKLELRQEEGQLHLRLPH